MFRLAYWSVHFWPWVIYQAYMCIVFYWIFNRTLCKSPPSSLTSKPQLPWSAWNLATQTWNSTGFLLEFMFLCCGLRHLSRLTLGKSQGFSHLCSVFRDLCLLCCLIFSYSISWKKKPLFHLSVCLSIHPSFIHWSSVSFFFFFLANIGWDWT